MQRTNLRVKSSGREHNTTLRLKTGNVDVKKNAARLICDWSSHICRMHDDCWVEASTQWLTEEGAAPRRQGFPKIIGEAIWTPIM